MKKNSNELLEQISNAISEICLENDYQFEGLHVFLDKQSLRARFTINEISDANQDYALALKYLRSISAIDDDLEPTLINPATNKNVEVNKVNFDNCNLPIMVTEDGVKRYISIEEFNVLYVTSAH
jgi:hypothetical protein